MENFGKNNYDTVDTTKKEQLSVADLMGLDKNSEVVQRFNENMEMLKNQVNKVAHLNESLLKLEIQENTTNQLAQLFGTDMDYVNFQDKANLLLEEVA